MAGPLSQPLAQTFINFVPGSHDQKYIHDLGRVPVK
jgi:hypothetical protein